MTTETRKPTPFELPLKYDNDRVVKYGKEEKVRANESEDKSKSFSVDNHGELTTGEYVSYLAYLEHPKLRRAGRFPPINPTRENYSKLVKLAEDLELDL
jgi:hypothetical protein